MACALLTIFLLTVALAILKPHGPWRLTGKTRQFRPRLICLVPPNTLPRNLRVPPAAFIRLVQSPKSPLLDGYSHNLVSEGDFVHFSRIPGNFPRAYRRISPSDIAPLNNCAIFVANFLKGFPIEEERFVPAQIRRTHQCRHRRRMVFSLQRCRSALCAPDDSGDDAHHCAFEE